MNRYYMAEGMVQRGPFEVRDLPGQGLRRETLVWTQGMPQWRRADEVEELVFAGLLTPATPVAPSLTPLYAVPSPPSPYAAASGKRIAAGVCAIVLGSLGVHKFILGRVGAGLIMLLATVFTCGWAGIVMHIVSIIEGLIYLTRTDEQFYYEYVVGKKAWL